MKYDCIQGSNGRSSILFSMEILEARNQTQVVYKSIRPIEATSAPNEACIMCSHNRRYLKFSLNLY